MKPLQWVKEKPSLHWAAFLGGFIYVEVFDDGWEVYYTGEMKLNDQNRYEWDSKFSLDPPGRFIEGKFATLTEAKAAAEEFYQMRITAHLK